MSPNESPTRSRFFLRLPCTMLAAAIFVYWCHLLSDSVYGEVRMLAGPVWLLRTRSIEDKIVGITGMIALLPGIFAVGIWRNALMVILSVIAILCWIAFGFWLEAMASC
jgi:hypothetical protein